LADVAEAVGDSGALELVAGERTYRVLDRIALGSISSVYRCGFGESIAGICKIARDPCTNDLLVNEAKVLEWLAAVDRGRFAPFLPRVEASIALREAAGSEARQANVLRMDEKIRSPDELYTLDEVRAAYPRGLGARHVAWIWRRVLSVLGFAHASGVVHGAVLPEHVLIEPREHKLVLIDWCCAALGYRNSPVAIVGGYRDWYAREGALRRAPTTGLDVALGARCMIELLGQQALEPGLSRYFARCRGRERADAWKLLEDFDRLIEATWGPRKFVELRMPPKRHAGVRTVLQAS
jgi:hypothetical protein